MTCTSVDSDNFQNTGAVGSSYVLNLTLRTQDETAGPWASYAGQGSRGRLCKSGLKRRIFSVVGLIETRVNSRSLAGLGYGPTGTLQKKSLQV